MLTQNIADKILIIGTLVLLLFCAAIINFILGKTTALLLIFIACGFYLTVFYSGKTRRLKKRDQVMAIKGKEVAKLNQCCQLFADAETEMLAQLDLMFGDVSQVKNIQSDAIASLINSITRLEQQVKTQEELVMTLLNSLSGRSSQFSEQISGRFDYLEISTLIGARLVLKKPFDKYQLLDTLQAV